MKITNLSIDSVKPYDRNPRVNDQAVPAVARSIKEFGFRSPIIVDGDHVIIAGHTRWKAAVSLGLAEVPCVVVTDLPPDKVKQLRIADNKTGELAEWNLELLAGEMATEVDWAALGFSKDELAEIFDPGVRDGLTDPDDVPAPPDDPITQRGDLWTLGNHRLLCGDGGSPADLDRLLGGARIQLVNMDPPYNVKVEPRSNNAIRAGRSSFEGNGRATHSRLRAKDRPIANDSMSAAEFETVLKSWFSNASRVLEPGRGFYIWGGYANCGNYPPALAGAGMHFSQAIIWVKEHPVINRKDFMGNHEWCFYGWKEGAGHKFFGAANAPDVWRISRAKSGVVAIDKGVRLEFSDGSRVDVLPPAGERRTVKVSDVANVYGLSQSSDVWSVKKVNPQSMVHLTEKPVELAVRAMRFSSHAGENVLDLFGGSGSTLIAAEQTGRKAFLMELDPPYCDVIVQRWEKFTGKKATRVAAAATSPDPAPTARQPNRARPAKQKA